MTPAVVVVAVSVALLVPSSHAIAAAKPHAIATLTTSPPIFDGSLDDTAWGLAVATDSFTQKLPTDGVAPSERTTVRVLYDREYLYIGIECEQRRSRIVGRLSRRDREVESDRVVVALDSRGTGTGAFEFGVNAAGVLVDSIRFNDTEQSFDWDENWEAKTRIGPDKWTAELRIPFRILRFSDENEHSFGFQVRRYLSEKQELDEWAYTPRTVAGEVSQYGRLDGIHLARPPGSIQVRPALVTEVRRVDPSAGRAAVRVRPEPVPRSRSELGHHTGRDAPGDRESGLRSGRGRSARAESGDVGNLLSREANVLSRRNRRVLVAAATGVHAAYRQGDGAPRVPVGSSGRIRSRSPSTSPGRRPFSGRRS